MPKKSIAQHTCHFQAMMKPSTEHSVCSHNLKGGSEPHLTSAAMHSFTAPGMFRTRARNRPRNCPRHASSRSISSCTVWVLKQSANTPPRSCDGTRRADRHGHHKMAFPSLFAFSGIRTERGCPVGIESISHPDTHNNRVKLLPETVLRCKSVQRWQWRPPAKCHFQTLVSEVNSPLNHECIYITLNKMHIFVHQLFQPLYHVMGVYLHSTDHQQHC
jgi:hypothetical protein